MVVGSGALRKLAWCRRAPALLPGRQHTPFNITTLWICQREPGRRTVNCYFKLPTWICITQCLTGFLRRWHKKGKSVGGTQRVRDVLEDRSSIIMNKMRLCTCCCRGKVNENNHRRCKQFKRFQIWKEHNHPGVWAKKKNNNKRSCKMMFWQTAVPVYFCSTFILNYLE